MPLAFGLGGSALGGAFAGSLGIGASFGASLGYLAGILLYSLVINPGSTTRNRAVADTFKIPLSAEGLPIPIVYGTQNIPLLVANWENFISTTTTKKQGGGGTGGGSKVESQEVTYSIDWMGALCFGKIDVVHSIDINKGKIYEGPLDYTTNVISTITTSDFGSLEFAWGTDPQPFSDYVNNLDTSPPRHNRISYLAAEEWNLGGSPSLQNIAATVSRFPETCIEGTINDSIREKNANPAGCVFDLLHHPYYGLRIPLSLMNLQSFKAAGETFASENLGVSMTIDRREDASDIIADILQVTNSFIYIDQNGNIAIKLNREGSNYVCDQIFDLNDSHIITGTLRAARTSENELTNQLEATWTDIDNDFIARTFSVFNLANFQQTGISARQTISLALLTNSEDATKVANRILVERGTSGTVVEVDVNKRSVRPWIGRTVRLAPSSWGGETIVGTISKVEEDEQRTDVLKLTIIEDKLANISDLSFGTPSDTDTHDDVTLEPFIRVKALQLPSGLYSGADNRVLLAVGQDPNEVLSGFNIFGADCDAGGEYTFIGFRERNVAAGDLIDDLSASAPDQDADATFRVCLDGFNDEDAESVSSALWANDYEIMCVGDELISIKTITPIEVASHANCSNAYRITGVRRGVLGTSKSAHSVGDDVFFVRGIVGDWFHDASFDSCNDDPVLCNMSEAELQVFTEEELQGFPECSERNLCFKAQPVGIDGSVVELADIDPAELVMSDCS